MDDPHGKPSNSERSDLEARIRQAASAGRISEADRDIRLRNVTSAQSATELDLIRRELDQLEGTLAPAVPGAVPGVGGSYSPPPTSSSSSSRSTVGPIALALIALALVGVVVAASAAAFVALRGDDDGSSSVPLPEAVPINSEEPAPTAEPTVESPAPGVGIEYGLTESGIRSFLAAYRAKFGTSQVVELTMYDDYVIVRVPVPGKKRNSGWYYRNDQGWSDFGGVSANFPGIQPVDTARINVPALVRNIERARRTLNVESPSLTYVNVDHRPQFDDRPNVDIYVSNEFHENGYLATRLNGSLERAVPFDQ